MKPLQKVHNFGVIKLSGRQLALATSFMGLPRMAYRIILFLLFVPLVAQAKVTIQPKIDVSWLHVIDANQATNNYENHQVGTLKPSLSIARTGSVWNSSLTADHTHIHQFETGFDNTEFSNLSLTNQLAFWNNRVSIMNVISRQNRNIDTSLGTTADPIFGQSEFVDYETVSTQLSLRNSPRSKWQNVLTLQHSNSFFDENRLEETDASVTNLNQGENKAASLLIGYGQNASQVHGGLQLSFSSTDRSNRGEQQSLNAALNLGVPLWGDIDFVVNGNKNKNMIANTALSDSNLESESYGAGLAWRFGKRSNIAVTYNKENRANADDFVGVKLEVFPSARSSLSYEQSQRFYGKSHSFNLAHTAKRWSVVVNYGENLGYQTRIQRENVSLGNFLCPIESVDVDDCTALETIPTEVESGFDIFELSLPVFTLDEEVVLSKTGSATLGYQFKKAKFSFTYSRSETEYLERPDAGLRETVNKSITYSHTMTRRNSFSLTASESSSTSDVSLGGARDSYRVDTSFTRKLSRKATGTISLVKFDNTSTLGNLDRQDTRVEVKYSYAF